MENIGGGLAFKATLDIDDFNVSAQAMERHIKDFSNTAAQEAAEVEESFQQMAQRAGQYITYYLVGQGMNNLVSSIVSVRGQFQQLEIAFGTMLGSEEKATALMQQMVNTAAKTPFDLMGVAEGAKQLLAYGVSAEKVNDTLVRLGNIASGLSIPLNDIVYLYGTTMVQGRLYAQDVSQFTGRGIPLVKELAEKYHTTAEGINEMVSAGKIGFPDVEEVLNKMTNAGGQFYQLMEKQSSSLTGQIANLQDAWDSALNSLGEKSEGALSAGIQSATYLVEHMDDVVRILKSVAIAYGFVKAATVLASVVTKGYTGIAVLDNAARTAKLALMKTEAVLSGEVVSQKKAMEAAEMANYAALQTTLTAEEQAAVVKQMRIAAIQSLLTAQQQEYLANLNLTASSSGYEAAAIGVMTAEQRLALSKQDLTAKSATYRAAIMQEAQAKMANQAQTVEAMRTTVREAACTVEAAKAKAIAATQATEAARYEVYWAQQSGNATAIASAQKKLEAAVDTQAAAGKAALSAQTDFYTKKKQLETAETLQAKTASIADTGAKTAQTAATNILSVATNKLSAGFKALWAAMAANPIGAVISAIGIVISLFTLFKGKTEEETDAMKEFEDGTKKVTDKLDLYYTILQQSEQGSKTHKEMLEKVNEVCKEYNTTLLDENDTLQEQEKKYLKVKAAIQATTAEKIKAKYVEEEMTKLENKSNNNYDSFDTRMNNLEAGTGTYRTVTSRSYGESNEVEITKAATNIQNMAPEIREAVRSLVEAGAKELATLSGDDFTKKYNEIVNNVVAGTKSGTHATDKEMEAFSSQLREYLDNEVRDVRTFNDAINLVNQNLNNFLAPKDTTNVDITKMSMEELHELANKLDGKTVSIDCKTYGFENALSLLKAVNDEINKKQNNLNTDSGIDAEIQKLKQMRDETEKFVKGTSTLTKEWTNLNSQIEKLQKRRAIGTDKGSNKRSGGGRKAGANDAQRNAENLRQKQLEAEKRLEEARIAVMEEGYEKRKAQLELQHKQSLQQIDKEEKELAEARKKAGKKGLTSDEKANFQERRNLENTSYAQSQNKLFEGELDYKKKQYQLYFRWVQNMGKEVADKQFEKLLTDGNSYKQYVENEIAKLEEKRNGGTKLTEGEGNYLISLNTQKGELNGETTALEKFKQQVSDSIGQCQTLAEKIEAVARAKERLENGESGIVSTDERAEASLSLSQQDAELQKELQNTVLNDYRTFEEQKLSITKQYDLLRKQAEQMGDAERLAQINKAEQEALSSLNMSYLQQSESWKNLFSDIDTLTVAQIEKLIADIQAQLNAGNLKLNPVDYKAVIDSLNQTKQRIQELNPFQALGTFYKDYIAARKRLKAAEAALAKGEGSKEDVEIAKRDTKSAAQGITNSIQKVTSISSDCASSLQSMFDALGMSGVADGLGTAIELMGQLGNAAASVGKFMSGDVLGGVLLAWYRPLHLWWAYSPSCMMQSTRRRYRTCKSR